MNRIGIPVIAIALSALVIGSVAMIPAAADDRPVSKEKQRVNDDSARKKKEVILVRTFDAPVEAVWKAWTDPEQVMRWWGPKQYTSPSCKIDFREGGKYLFCMRAPKEHGGQDMYTTGVYKKILPMKEIAFSQCLCDKDGNAVDPAKLGMPPDFPKEIPTVVTFKNVAGKTTVTVIETGWTPGQMFDFSEAGMSECLDKLAETLPKR